MRRVLKMTGCFAVKRQSLLSDMRPLGPVWCNPPSLGVSQVHSLWQVASHRDDLVFEADFMEGAAHAEPENRLLLLPSAHGHQT